MLVFTAAMVRGHAEVAISGDSPVGGYFGIDPDDRFLGKFHMARDPLGASASRLPGGVAPGHGFRAR